MPRKRSSRLLPTVTTLLEELTRDLVERVRASLAESLESQAATVAELRVDVRRLERRLERLPPSRGGRGGRDVRRCRVAGCEEPHVAKGFCKNHYQQTRYREKKVADAKAHGKRYAAPKPGERRPGRKPKVPLPT